MSTATILTHLVFSTFDKYAALVQLEQIVQHRPLSSDGREKAVNLNPFSRPLAFMYGVASHTARGRVYPMHIQGKS